MRLVTLELTITLLKRLVMQGDQSLLLDCHLAAAVGAKEESTSLLRNFYKVSKVSSKSSDRKLITFENKVLKQVWRPIHEVFVGG